MVVSAASPTYLEVWSEGCGAARIKCERLSKQPRLIVGTLFHLLYFGQPELDPDGRPLLFY